MRVTPIMGKMPGFWQRSINHMKRQTAYAVRMEGLTTPTKPYPLIQFSSPDILDHCKSMSDRGLGGFSQSELTFHAGNTPALDLSTPVKTLFQNSMTLQTRDAEPPHILWSGSISTELPRNNPQIQRTGFAGWRTRDMGYSVFGKVLWDLGQYNYLTLRVKSDGRKYFVNIQTDSLVPTDLHQHILSTTTIGQWETVTIPFSAFVRTNQGLVVEPQNEMNRMKVKSVGVALTDRIQGPFKLAIAEVFATALAGKKVARQDSGFDVEQDDEVDEDGGMMSTPQPKRKPGEPEQIMM